MSIVKGKTCHNPSGGYGSPGACDTDCPHWSKYEPCPMWIPPKYWFGSICDGCIHNGETCEYEYMDYPPSGDILACFGFEEKPPAVRGESESEQNEI